ncbi:unnamed protein product, partial [Medioppia subpectinata]
MNSWLKIDGMTCNSCVHNIETTVHTIDGVLNIEIYLEDGKAFLTYDPTLTSDQIIAKRIDDMGFDCSVDDTVDHHSNDLIEAKDQMLSAWLEILGMTCMSCVNNIKSVVQPMSGVHSIEIYLKDNEAFVQFDRQLVSAQEIAKRIDDMGFDCKVMDNRHETRRDSELNSLFAVQTPIAESPKRVVNNSVDHMVYKRPDSVSKLKYSDTIAVDLTDLEKCVLNVSGMTCASCVANIERNLGKVEGIHGVLVALLSQ